MPPAQSPQADFTFLTHSRVWIMGVINVTPDSFYEGARFADATAAAEHAARLLQEGADILDIGAESTRPGSHEVPAEEELHRLLPVVEKIRARFPNAPIAVDTRKAIVAREALRRGASMVNDISAMRHDPAMAGVIAESGAPVVLMHMQGTPETMQIRPQYKDVVAEVRSFFEERLCAAERAGIAPERMIVDPGIGFGKRLEDNVALLRGLSELKKLGRPVLVGASRKSFLGRLSVPDQTALEAGDRLPASLAAALLAVQRGASGLRVHDVAATRWFLNAWQALSDTRGK